MAVGQRFEVIMREFRNWLERWSQKRAEKNRRFKIPCHLGVAKAEPTGEASKDEERRPEGRRVCDADI